ncbi:unnamed protein product [Calypogeia fissa]
MRTAGGAAVGLILLGLVFGVIHGFQISVEVDEQQQQQQTQFESHLKLPTQEEGEKVDDQKPFDYFVFSQQWPGTYCKQSGTCCEKIKTPATFTVHGLWPEYNDGSYPGCCSGPGFEQAKVDELEDLLQEYWPTMSCSSPTQCNGKKTGSFWQHEWEKHGTCAYPTIPDEATYFIVGLNLRLKYDLLKILKDAGFVPSSSEMYQSSEMAAAIKSAVGGWPILTCWSKQVQEIWICFTKDLKIRDCGSSSNSCSTILFPPFSL